MSFLFPLYLLGAAALAVPILLHLRRRPPKEHVPFSSHFLLEQTPERLVRRTRVERWLLLALRCLALLLLAFAFSRPFLRSMTLPTERSAITRAVILIDRSASMHREDLWKQAVDAAQEALNRYGATDQVAVAVFDEQVEWIRQFTDEIGSGTIATRLAETTPSWRATDLGLAMSTAADRLLAADGDDPAGKREVVVIGDFQEGAKRDRLRSGAWPEEVSVLPVSLATEAPGNLSLSLATTPARANVEEEEVYRVRIRNASDSDEATTKLAWQGYPDTAIETTVAPGTGRILTTAPRPADAVRGVLEVVGDAHGFDNEVYVSPVQARPLRVLCLSEQGNEETAGSPLFYLRRALQPTPTLEPIVEAATDLAFVDAENTEVIVATGSWSPASSATLQNFAKTGGLVIAVPSAEATPDTVSLLIDQPGWLLGEADVTDYSLLADLDFDHPVLEPFARAQIRDFTKVRFWKHRDLAVPDEMPDSTRVVASFDDGSPALIEHRIGEGTIFFFLSGWEPRESQLALSSKFVPLLFSLFDHTGYSIRSAATLYVGETEHESPGFYGEGSGLVAVNLAPSEGDTVAFDPAVVFADWGIPLIDDESDLTPATLTETQRQRLESAEKEDSQKLWKWLILLVLALLIVESWVAGRPGNRRIRSSNAAAATA